MLLDGSDLLTNNYVLLETSALLQHRLGLPRCERSTRMWRRWCESIGLRKAVTAPLPEPCSRPGGKSSVWWIA